MQPITAIVITLNEEDNIRPCIESLQRVCDEIIVVDSGSDDKTVEIAESLGATVYHQPYLGDGPQKAFGVPYARNDWILSIDADERLDEDMVRDLEGLDMNATDFDSFAFRRKSFVGDTWIKVWYPDYLVRLYNRQTAGFEPVRGHAKVSGNNTKRLHSHIIHYSYRNYREVVQRIDRFAARGASVLYEQGHRPNAWSPLLHGLGAFLKTYIAKKGILHGLPGLNIAVVSAFSSYIKYVMLQELYANGGQG